MVKIAYLFTWESCDYALCRETQARELSLVLVAGLQGQLMGK